MTLFFLPVSISVSLSLALWPEVLLPEDGALAPGQPLLLPAGCFGKTLCAAMHHVLVTRFVFKAKASEVATSILAPILLHHRSIFLFF